MFWAVSVSLVQSMSFTTPAVPRYYHVYQSKYVDSDPNSLQLWCMNNDGGRTLLRCNNVPVFCYIELPPIVGRRAVKWTSDAVDSLLWEISNQKDHNVRLPTSHSFARKRRFYYYQERENVPMIEVHFNTVSAMYSFTNYITQIQQYTIGKFACKVWENNIDAKRRVFTERNCRYSQWFSIEIKGQPDDCSKISNEKEEFFADWKTITPEPGYEQIASPRILSFDIETYSHRNFSLPCAQHFMDEVYMVSMIFWIYGKLEATLERHLIVVGETDEIPGSVVHTVSNEKELLDKFTDLIFDLNPDVITGYNIYAYDYPYMRDRMSGIYMEEWGETGPLCADRPKMKSNTWASSATGKMTICYLDIPGRINIDLFPMIKRDYKLDKYSLDFVSKYFIGDGKHDVSALEMFKAYEGMKSKQPENWKKTYTSVASYCIQDAVLVAKLFEKLNVWTALVEMSNITGVEMVNVIANGQQMRCYSQIYNEAHSKGYVLDKRDFEKIDYQGGYVGDPIVGCHDSVICLDFASLYPSIMMAYNICHTTLVAESDVDDIDPENLFKITVSPSPDDVEDDSDDTTDEDSDIPKKRTPRSSEQRTFYFVKPHVKKGILPALLEDLISERKSVRAKMAKTDENSLTHVILDKRQLSLKIFANSLYGFLGTQEGGKMPLIEGAMCITHKGRELICEVNRYLEDKYKAKIVYNDTDSCMVQIPGITNEKCDEFGSKLAVEVSSLFPPPLKLEFEKAMRILCIKKKKYASFLIGRDGKFLKEPAPSLNEKIMAKGIVLARRDNFGYLRVVYMDVLRMILNMTPMIECLKKILYYLDNIKTLEPRGNLTIIRTLGKTYASETFFLKTFASELASKGNPVHPGDRLEYVVVEAGKDTGEPLGMRMRLIDMYEDSVKGIGAYPYSPVDFSYYLTNGLQKPIDQLFSIAYSDVIAKDKTYDENDSLPEGKKRRNRKPLPLSEPVSVYIRIKENLGESVASQNVLKCYE